ncbi:MAG: hypothetical protein Q9170_007112 [Blastenia crenularia]
MHAKCTPTRQYIATFEAPSSSSLGTVLSAWHQTHHSFLLTLTLHLTELVVNISRDEQTWRLAAHNGAQRSSGMLGSLKSAACNWKTVFLFLLKSVAYWMFSLAINSDGGRVYMSWVGILVLLAGASVVAAFGTFLAWTRPSGPQPATFGHIQTLANLIDEWYEEAERIWWGDKGVVGRGDCAVGKGRDADWEKVRHAGVAICHLGNVDLSALYRLTRCLHTRTPSD